VDTDRRVVLLDDAGNAIGDAPRDAVHTAETPLHLAFSCYLLNSEGRVLLTRRALTKRTWPGVWTNSFCGHPAPGESMEHAVRRHARDELGVPLDSLTLQLPDFRYRAVDAGGIVENELCPVFIATVGAPIQANPEEVAEWAWVDPRDLVSATRSLPHVFSPWAVRQLPQLADALVAASSIAASAATAVRA
jgi:isopentenyl-diphosphate delta-isomerase